MLGSCVCWEAASVCAAQALHFTCMSETPSHRARLQAAVPPWKVLPAFPAALGVTGTVLRPPTRLSPGIQGPATWEKMYLASCSWAKQGL